MVRTCFRKRSYLSEPRKYRNPESLDGKIKLSNDLVNFSFIARENITEYVSSKLSGKNVEMEIIHVIESEMSLSESVEALTKSQLKVKMFEVIYINDDEAMFQEAVFNKSVKQKTKPRIWSSITKSAN